MIGNEIADYVISRNFLSRSVCLRFDQTSLSSHYHCLLCDFKHTCLRDAEFCDCQALLSGSACSDDRVGGRLRQTGINALEDSLPHQFRASVPSFPAPFTASTVSSVTKNTELLFLYFNSVVLDKPVPSVARLDFLTFGNVFSVSSVCVNTFCQLQQTLISTLAPIVGWSV